MAVVLGDRPSAAAAIRQGAARLWARGAFASSPLNRDDPDARRHGAGLGVVERALARTIDGARLLGSPNVDADRGAARVAVWLPDDRSGAVRAALAALLNPFLAGGPSAR
jgi:hypothetical protein